VDGRQTIAMQKAESNKETQINKEGELGFNWSQFLCHTIKLNW